MVSANFLKTSSYNPLIKLLAYIIAITALCRSLLNLLCFIKCSSVYMHRWVSTKIKKAMELYRKQIGLRIHPVYTREECLVNIRNYVRRWYKSIALHKPKNKFILLWLIPR
jgi:hypothetical protein